MSVFLFQFRRLSICKPRNFVFTASSINVSLYPMQYCLAIHQCLQMSTSLLLQDVRSHLQETDNSEDCAKLHSRTAALPKHFGLSCLTNVSPGWKNELFCQDNYYSCNSLIKETTLLTCKFIYTLNGTQKRSLVSGP
jgi:hypothetical protein